MSTLPNGLTLIAYTQHWYRDADTGTWYREAWVRDASGVPTYVGIRDDLAGGES